MRSFVIVGSLALALAGCQTTNPVSARTLYEVMATYDAAFLTPAAHYRQLGLCAKAVASTLQKPCADPVVVGKLQKADASVQVAVKNAKDFILANPTLSAASYISAAQSAVSAAISIAAINGVK